MPPYKDQNNSRQQEKLREQLIGLGERSLRKSYYPELQQRIDDLKRFRALLDQSNDLIFLLQLPSGRIVDINEAVCRQLGYAREKILLSSFDVFLSEAGTLWSRIGKKQEEIANLYRETTTTTFRKCDGYSIPVEVTFSLVTFENARYAVVVARDITERLRAEKELQKAHLMLEQRVEERTAVLLQLSESLKAEIAERKKAEEQLRFLSLHDHATGLYNRAYLSEEMRRLDTGRDYPVSLIICDLDGLKMINDSLGHKAGDQLLIQAAQILSAGVREGDVVSRVGGDEFVILLPRCAQKDVENVISRIKSLAEKYNLSNSILPLNISLGYATTVHKSKRIDDLYKEADDHMYQVKLNQRAVSHSSIVQAIKHISESKDFAEQGHLKRLQNMAEAMGKAVKLSAENIQQLRLFAEYHDLGKLGISDSILRKPGPLTSAERTEIKLHCEIGRRIAQAIPQLLPVADWILKHHECWDGSGYPLGLKAEEIPLECRILAIVDTFDAMTDYRPYRNPLSREEAILELKNNAGTKFDEKLVEHFIEILNNNAGENWD